MIIKRKTEISNCKAVHYAPLLWQHCGRFSLQNERMRDAFHANFVMHFEGLILNFKQLAQRLLMFYMKSWRVSVACFAPRISILMVPRGSNFPLL